MEEAGLLEDINQPELAGEVKETGQMEKKTDTGQENPKQGDMLAHQAQEHEDEALEVAWIESSADIDQGRDMLLSAQKDAEQEDTDQWQTDIDQADETRQSEAMDRGQLDEITQLERQIKDTGQTETLSQIQDIGHTLDNMDLIQTLPSLGISLEHLAFSSMIRFVSS
jgi:hypothetical protein